MNAEIMPLLLPNALASRLERGVPEFDIEAKNRLRTILRPGSFGGGFVPELFSIADIQRSNRIWQSQRHLWYLGNRLPDVKPGVIDPAQTIIFGQIEPESPLALDLRKQPDEVIYFGDVHSQSCWIGLNMCFIDFVTFLFG